MLRNLTSIVRGMLAVAILAGGLHAADATAPLSPEESAFIQQNMNAEEKQQFTQMLFAEPPGDPAAMQARSQSTLLIFKAKLAARGVAFGAPAAGAPPAAPAPAAQAVKTPLQTDVEFLQKNLKPEEWQQVTNAYAMSQSDGNVAGFERTVTQWMGRLAARGIKPQNAAAAAVAPYQPKSKNVQITPTDTGEIQVVQILPTGFEFKLPSRDETIPAGATQSVTWIDPADDAKGVKAAGFLAADGSKAGLWLEWNSAWKLVSGGVYAAGKPSGEWVEYEYAADPAVETAKHVGSYANGVRTGVWKTEYTREHPLVIEARKKLGAKADGTITQSLNERDGYHQTDTYADGKVVKTERDFTP